MNTEQADKDKGDEASCSTKNEKKARVFDIDAMVEMARHNTTLTDPVIDETEDGQSVISFDPLTANDDEEPSTSVDYVDGDFEEFELNAELPISHEATIKFGSKPVSALASDPSGSRMVIGGFDYNVSFYDFAGTDSTLKPFRTLQPVESHVVTSLSYNSAGDNIAVCSGDGKPRILARDGKQWVECVKGDQYLVDVSHTKGHLSTVNCGAWCPKQRLELLTCADDGSFRFWDFTLTDFERKKCSKVVKPRGGGGRVKIFPVTCLFSRDCKYFGGGCSDGSIQLWEYHKTSYVFPKLYIKDAHTDFVTSLAFSYDGNNVLSRSLDKTMKLWDLRSFRKPVHVAENLDAYFRMHDCVFSPDNKSVVTGTFVPKNSGEAGKLVFLDRDTFEVKQELEYPGLSVTRILWHPRLNQLFAGLSDGRVQVYYDPKRSDRGVLTGLAKPVKTKTIKFIKEERVITPYTLKHFRDDKEISTYKLIRMARPRPAKSYKPQPPVESTVGVGGKPGAAGGTLHTYLAHKYGLIEDLKDEGNVREQILSHADEDQYWTGVGGWNEKPILIPEQKPEKKDDELQPVFKKSKQS